MSPTPSMYEKVTARCAELESENATLRMEKDAIGSQLLDVQQDCIKATQENVILRRDIRELQAGRDADRHFSDLLDAERAENATLRRRVEELERDNASLREANEIEIAETMPQHVERMELRSALRTAVEALQWYADDQTWAMQYDYEDFGSAKAMRPVGSFAEHDSGERARAALSVLAAHLEERGR